MNPNKQGKQFTFPTMPRLAGPASAIVARMDEHDIGRS